MSTAPPARGRPRIITPERLADAGIAIGLPRLTVVGMAGQLGVSHMALYKHVSGLEALKTLVAEAMFLRWPLPEPGGAGLRCHLEALSLSMWRLVAAHPGIAPYMLRLDMITPAMAGKIRAHQELVASHYGLSFAEANWLLFTVAFHCVAVADTVLPEPLAEGAAPEDPALAVISEEYARGIRALIRGVLLLLDEEAAGGV